ncbi:MAG: hypothetical protein KAW16_00105 [candidate division Zixibacteria bacterium]|nr:hypothetical protein [candidate division Zixibacteria bacterium]
MPKTNQHPVISEINALQDIYLHCRSVFPALTDEIVGHCEFTTAPYYLRRGYMAQIKLEKPITPDFLKENRKLVKWINENAIIRLYGIMKYHGFLNNIDQNSAGWKEVDLMRRMRNAFTKTGLNYRPEDPDNIRLKDEVIEHFKLNKNDFTEGEIPTPIDTVVERIFEACRKYIEHIVFSSGALRA